LIINKFDYIDTRNQNTKYDHVEIKSANNSVINRHSNRSVKSEILPKRAESN